MDKNTQIALGRYLKFKGFNFKWVSDYDGHKFCYNMNIHHEDPELHLNLHPKNFIEITDQLIKAFNSNMNLDNKGFLLSLHLCVDEDGYETTYLYYNSQLDDVTFTLNKENKLVLLS